MSENPKNIVKVSFNGAREAYLEEEEGLVQYDYGQYLIFEDIELPDSYTVHFGNEKEDGLSKPMVGDANGVEIPPEYIETGLPVWAWVFMHETELDGETEYIVKIPVKRRSRPTNYAPTQIQQSAIDQAIAALNAGATRAAAAAAAAEESKTAAKASEDNAKDSETAAKESEDNAKDSETAAAQSAEQAKHAAESMISLNFTDFDTGDTYGYGLGIKDGYPALKIYTNTEG